jgi:anti-sigma28 factor (negative regulator of flagellin synthesis)
MKNITLWEFIPMAMEGTQPTHLIKSFGVYARGNDTRHESAGLAFEEAKQLVESGKPVPSATESKGQGWISGRDSILISNEAKAAYMLQKITSIVKNAPDMRGEKIKELKDKILNGSLLMRDISEKIAERIRTQLARGLI